MPVIQITEFADLDRDASGRTIMVGRLPAIATQTVDFAGGATQSSVFNAKTRFVRISSDTNCNIASGDNPTATTSDTRVTADVAEYLGVAPGHRLSVV